MRRRKKVFQSSTTEEAGGLKRPAGVAGVGSEGWVVVEACRQRDGVKNEEGVLVGGGVAETTGFLDNDGRVGVCETRTRIDRYRRHIGEHDSEAVSDGLEADLDGPRAIEPFMDRRRPSLAVSANMLSCACTMRRTKLTRENITEC